VTLSDFLHCVKRWLEKAPNVIKRRLPPFTPTGDINDALFIMYRSPQNEYNPRIYEPFDCSPRSTYFSVQHFDLGFSFNDEQADEYFVRLIRKTKPMNDMDTEIKQNEIVWKSKFADQADDKLKIGDELKEPKKIRQIEERDNPNRIWIETRGAKAFIDQKIKNILEFKALCEKFK
jgi:hypothetical protein